MNKWRVAQVPLETCLFARLCNLLKEERGVAPLASHGADTVPDEMITYYIPKTFMSGSVSVAVTKIIPPEFMPEAML
eukprot:5795616-Amphidinium_carterae.1